MNQEVETKVLNINVEEIIAKLQKLGAKELPQVLFKRWVFDTKCGDGKWIRLRTDGNTQEIETTVEDFDKVAQILANATWEKQSYQESKRQLFLVDELEFAIDTWPKLAPLLEIEGKSVEAVQAGLQALGLTGQDIGDKHMEDIYQDQGIDLRSFDRLTFQ